MAMLQHGDIHIYIYTCTAHQTPMMETLLTCNGYTALGIQGSMSNLNGMRDNKFLHIKI